MKNLRYIALTAALLLAPAFVLAQSASIDIGADVRVKQLPAVRPAASAQVRVETKANVDASHAEMQANREQKREEMRTKMEERQTEVRAKIEAAKTKAQEKYGEAAQRSVGNIVDMLTKATERLGGIADKISARIIELQGMGVAMDGSAGLYTRRYFVGDATKRSVAL